MHVQAVDSGLLAGQLAVVSKLWLLMVLKLWVGCSLLRSGDPQVDCTACTLY